MSVESTGQPDASPEAVEGRLGTWLGRLGIAVVLTGLVVFANHAYRGGARTSGRIATLALLYAASAVVLWLGLRLWRRSGAGAGYSLVLVSGALAGAYYTTYAAHYVPALQVVRSPLVATVLLLAVAGAMVWLADRLRSPGMALLAILLAVYAGVVSRPVVSFTLISNAVLAAAAFVFLVRNGWSALSLGLVAATYLTFGSWQLYREDWVAFPLYLGVGESARSAGLVFLYGALFTAPIVLSADVSFTDRWRAAFLALNSAFAWALVGLVLPRSEPRAFSVAFGAFGLALLALAFLLTRRRPEWVLSYEAARTKAWVLLAVAVATLWTGSHPALIVALVGLALAMAAQLVDSRVLRAATFLVSLLAAALGAAGARQAALPAVVVGALLVFTAWWVDRHGEPAPRLNLGSVYFSALGLSVWLVAALARAPRGQRPLVLAVLAVVLTAGAHLVRLVPAAFMAQAFLVAAHVTFLRRAAAFAGPTRNVVAVVAATLILSAWWRSRPETRLIRISRRLFTLWYAVAVVGVLFVWMRWRLPPESSGAWLAVPALVAVAVLVYAILSGDWAVGVLGQAYLLMSLAGFWLWWDEVPPPWPRPSALWMLAPLAALVAVAALLDRWREGSGVNETRSPAPVGAAWDHRLSVLARTLACLMFVVWVYWYVPARGQFLLLELVAVVLLVWAARREDRVNVALSTLLSTGAVLLFWVSLGGHDGFGLADLAAFALLLTQQQLWRRGFAGLVPTALHDPAMVMGVGSLWRWVHLAMACELGAPWVTVGWAVVGLVVCGLGFLLHERGYRQLGLTILFAALVRVAVLDRAELETFYRLVSVLVIGAIFLVLGFAYERYRPGAVRPT